MMNFDEEKDIHPDYKYDWDKSASKANFQAFEDIWLQGYKAGKNYRKDYDQTFLINPFGKPDLNFQNPISEVCAWDCGFTMGSYNGITSFPRSYERWIEQESKMSYEEFRNK